MGKTREDRLADLREKKEDLAVLKEIQQLEQRQANDRDKEKDEISV